MKARALVLLLALAFAAHAALAGDHPARWIVYYNNELPTEAFLPYDVIVFDSDSHPRLDALKAKHAVVLGYLSLGEAENYRSYYKTVRDKNLLLKANPKWKGHTTIDVRKPEWTDYVLDSLIPPILAQGFDGIMIDTMDSALQPEIDDPKHYPGMHAASVRLIKSIRARYPGIVIMLNRGFPLLPDVAGDIDMVMAESIYADWQPGSKKPVILPRKEYLRYVQLLRSAQKQSPKLRIFTIDYWPLQDKKGIKRIYDMQRSQGFVPYVSSLNLQTLSPEPR